MPGVWLGFVLGTALCRQSVLIKPAWFEMGPIVECQVLLPGGLAQAILAFASLYFPASEYRAAMRLGF